ncbi:MAG: ATP-binding protein [Coleofasciculus sp. B1-GNL1-01]|uniref:ATP-binding protein n=1 Tax=Coleofasciculus sp. B1-GNL1-01 TaxID=3068484 RepID=UPI0032F294B5
MLFSNSRYPPVSPQNALMGQQNPLNLNKNLSEIFPFTWIKEGIRNLSISHKISYGYALAIGLSILGTTGGLILGNYYQDQAQQQERVADQQHHLLSNLENATLAVRSHPQELLTASVNSNQIDAQKNQYLADVDRMKRLLSELDIFIQDYPDGLDVNTAELHHLLQEYEANIDAYNQVIESLWQISESENLKPEEVTAIQQELLKALHHPSTSQVMAQFNHLSDHVEDAKTNAEAQQSQVHQQLAQAEALRLRIIVSSLLLSVGIAVLLATITSRAIAHPIETVTHVASAIVKESNLEIRTPVTTNDEVGSLATSLNQLVQWVDDSTQELTQARQTLEQRVDERTQELTQALRELQHTQAQLIQSEKMSSLGQMVAGIAHEINNPINFIYGNLDYAKRSINDLLILLELYRQEYPQPNAAIQEQSEAMDLDFLIADMPKMLSSLKSGAERIQEVVLSLRNFCRLDEAQLKRADIHEGLENTLLLVSHRLQPNINLVKKYSQLPRIDCYPAQLNQAFINIISNAIDALEEVQGKAIPTIVIRSETIDNRWIRVSVWNNGAAIPGDVKDRIFDPFFTTKSVGKGTGMGLAICYQIVKKHQGKIEVTSEPEKGTEFAITLPIQTEQEMALSA